MCELPAGEIKDSGVSLVGSWPGCLCLGLRPCMPCACTDSVVCLGSRRPVAGRGRVSPGRGLMTTPLIHCPSARIGAPKQSMMSTADSPVHRRGRRCASPAGCEQDAGAIEIDVEALTPWVSPSLPPFPFIDTRIYATYLCSARLAVPGLPRTASCGHGDQWSRRAG